VDEKSWVLEVMFIHHVVTNLMVYVNISSLGLLMDENDLQNPWFFIHYFLRICRS